MSTFTEIIKKTPKWEWYYLSISIFISLILQTVFRVPRLITDVFFQGAASFYFIYISFFKENCLPTKSKLVGAFIGGAFIWMFIESCSKLFARWAVYRFF